MSLREKFKGTGVAIVTPFDAESRIDWPSFEKIIDHIINGGAEYLVVLGTTGESATIHGAGKQEVFDFVSKTAASRCGLIAGIGGNDTQELVSQFKSFRLTGYDAILTVSPYYNKPNQEGLYQHYKTVNAAAPLPVMMYNVPARTGQNLTAETQLRIANDCPNIFATKEASGNLEQIMQIISQKPDPFMVISGDDGLTLPMIACGADGVVSVVANAYPRTFSNMVRYCLAGNYTAARPLNYSLSDIIQSMFAEGSPSGVKAYLTEMGLCQYHFRQPVWPVSEALYQKIKKLLAEGPEEK
jgi:4-hydroxy-tetrahydrodipicolinate synthase